MKTNSNFKTLKYLVLILLLCPLLLFVGCQETCNTYYVEETYGAFKVTFYIDGEEYTTRTTNEKGYLPYDEWPKPQESGYKFYGWYFDEAFEYPVNNFRIGREFSLYGKLTKQIDVTLNLEDTLVQNAQSKNFTLDINSNINTIDSKEYKIKGYHIAGFYLDESFTQAIEQDTPLTENTKIYIDYALSTYTITYKNTKDYVNNNVTEYTYADLLEGQINFEPLDCVAYFEFFDYWTDENGVKEFYISKHDSGYSNRTLTAVYKSYNLVHVNGGSNYFEIGFYPQSLKESSVTIDETNVDSRGYFKGSDNYWYAKQTADLFANTASIEVENGIIEDGKNYYFKVEPIKWQILTDPLNDYDYYGLLSINILDCGTFGPIIQVPYTNGLGWVSHRSESENVHKFATNLKDNFYSADAKKRVGVGNFNGYNFLNAKERGDKIGIHEATDYSIAKGLQVDENNVGMWWLVSSSYGHGEYVGFDGQPRSSTAYPYGTPDDLILKSDLNPYTKGLGYVPYSRFNRKV